MVVVMQEIGCGIQGGKPRKPGRVRSLQALMDRKTARGNKRKSFSVKIDQAFLQCSGELTNSVSQSGRLIDISPSTSSSYAGLF